MTIVSRTHPYVIGVDTHAASHTLAIVTGGGERLDTATFPATTAGIGRAIDWAGRRCGGDTDALWAIEGIGSYGAGIAGRVAAAGYRVTEAPRMDARNRRGVGKSDPLDAAAIATATLSVPIDRLRRPRQDEGLPAALQTLTTAREQMTGERTANVNALTGLLRATPLQIDARKPLTAAQIDQISRWRARPTEPLAAATARHEATRLARRITDLDQQLRDNQTRITSLIQASPAAPLLEETGIGPVTAAAALTAWSHPGRVRSAAAFVALAGTNPIPASSGNTTRHRLNRGGDRRLNRALHMAAISRMTHDPTTRAYVQRRTAEGRTSREIRRCIKRYLARHLYRRLNTLHTT